MSPSDETILAEIRRVVETERPEHATSREVGPGDRLVEDLGLDSLTLTTLAVALEDRFQILLSDEEATRIRTVGELVACVARRAGGGA